MCSNLEEAKCGAVKKGFKEYCRKKSYGNMEGYNLLKLYIFLGRTPVLIEKHGRSLFYVPGLLLDDPALRFFGVLSIFSRSAGRY